MIRTLTVLGKTVWAFCFPHFCPSCAVELTPYETPCCLSCQAQLPFTHFENFLYNPVYEKLQSLICVQQAAAMLYWEEHSIVQSLMHQLKFQRQKSLGTWLGSLWGQRLQNSPFVHCSALVPLPLHPKKQKKRGYNQKVCEQLSKWLNIPLIENAVYRSKNTQQLSQSQHLDRFKEMENAFTPNKKIKPSAPHWLLVDDVLTTGATLQSCGQALLEFPNGKLSILTLACRM